MIVDVLTEIEEEMFYRGDSPNEMRAAMARSLVLDMAMGVKHD